MGKTTIIYHVGHYGYLFRFFLLRMTVHKNDDALFLVDKSGMDKATRIFTKKLECIRFGRLKTFGEGSFSRIVPQNEFDSAVDLFYDKLLGEWI